MRSEVLAYSTFDNSSFKINQEAIRFQKYQVNDNNLLNTGNNVVDLDSYRRQRSKDSSRLKKKNEIILTAESPLTDYITHFDQDWQKEGLPQDWYNLRGRKSEVGFSMRKQMDLITDPGNPGKLANWTRQTKQDLIGFKLEYLSNHLVYPCKYTVSANDPARLESREYGNKDITETVSIEERNGSVRDGLKAIKAFFLSPDTPDGSISVMTSPKGDTGLKTDKGENIEYPDSYFFIMQKTGNEVKNYTIKTDFSVHESREVIYQLTGKRLSPTAPLEEYVRQIAAIKPGSTGGINSVTDVIRVLQTTRPSHAFEETQSGKKIGWNEVYKDVAQGEKLYNFNQKTQKQIEDFEAFCRSGDHTKEDLQKAIAATILRMSALFLEEESRKSSPQIQMAQGEWSTPGQSSPEAAGFVRQSFGSVLEKVAERPGCAGGGKKTAVDTIGGSRSAEIIKSREYEFDHKGTCVSCHSGPKDLGPCNICELCVQNIEFMDALNKKGANDNEAKKDNKIKKTA